MEGLLFAAILIACPVGMGAMMWFMMKMMKGNNTADRSNGDGNVLSPEARLASLEAEKELLERQMAAANPGGNAEADLRAR